MSDLRLPDARHALLVEWFQEGIAFNGAMGNRVAVARMEVFTGTPGDGAEPIATGQAVYNVVRRE